MGTFGCVGIVLLAGNVRFCIYRVKLEIYILSHVIRFRCGCREASHELTPVEVSVPYDSMM